MIYRQRKNFLGKNINLYDVDIVDGSFVGELVRWSLRKHPKNCWIATLQQSHFLCSKHSSALQRIPSPEVSDFFVNQSILNDIQQFVLGGQRMCFPSVGIV